MLKNITYISASTPKRRKTAGKKRPVKRDKSSPMTVNTAKLLIIFIMGIVAGTLFINIFCSGGYDKFGIYSKYFIDIFHDFDVEKRELFLYSFWNRTKEILLLLVLSCTSLGSIAAEVFLAYKGLTVGILISVYVVQYGIGGLLLYGMSVFPHYITYVLMVMLMVSFSKEIYNCLKKYREDLQAHIREAGRMIIKTKLASYLKCLFLIFILNVLTSYLETFINLSIMKNILE